MPPKNPTRGKMPQDSAALEQFIRDVDRVTPSKTKKTTTTTTTSSGSGGTVLYDSGHLGADTASIDTGANGIAGGFTYLTCYAWVRTSQVAALGTVEFTFNNDTGGNYDRVNQGGTGAVAAANIPLNAHGNGARANRFSIIKIDIPMYTNTSFEREAIFYVSVMDSALASSAAALVAVGYRSTAALTQMKVAGGGGTNLKAGSRLLIIGF